MRKVCIVLLTAVVYSQGCVPGDGGIEYTRPRPGEHKVHWWWLPREPTSQPSSQPSGNATQSNAQDQSATLDASAALGEKLEIEGSEYGFVLHVDATGAAVTEEWVRTSIKAPFTNEGEMVAGSIDLDYGENDLFDLSDMVSASILVTKQLDALMGSNYAPNGVTVTTENSKVGKIVTLDGEVKYVVAALLALNIEGFESQEADEDLRGVLNREDNRVTLYDHGKPVLSAELPDPLQ